MSTSTGEMGDEIDWVGREEKEGERIRERKVGARDGEGGRGR